MCVWVRSHLGEGVMMHQSPCPLSYTIMLVTNIMISFTFGLIDAATVAALHNVGAGARASITRC